MTIKRRLLSNLFITAAGILVIGTISLYAFLKIKASVNVLAGQATQVQIKTPDQQIETMSRKQGEVVRRVNETIGTAMTFMVIASMVILISVIAVNAKIASGLNNPLRTIKEIRDTIKSGALIEKAEITSNDEMGQMHAAFNDIVDQFHNLMSEMSETVFIINTSADILFTASEQQASFFSQLASSVSEISSTTEELSASSNQIADYAGSVLELAGKSWQTSKDGASAVGNITVKMNEIYQDNQDRINEIVELGRKSREITRVMDIINKIADQTKLIAFNAGIEAATGGEAGKRFGVVAVEIRRLADSVRESTVEIEGKIKEMLESVDKLVMTSKRNSGIIQEGVEFAKQTTSRLDDIVCVVDETNKSAKQISLSTQQQKIATGQVAIAMREIVAGAKKTSHAISEINSVSKEMTVLSNNLNEMVKKFKFGNEHSKNSE